MCILDSLNSRFALAWRQGLPLAAPYPPLPFGQFDEEREEKQHIDSVHPELIVLAALALAVKFLDDKQQTTRMYASIWGKDLWTWDQVNFTQRVILENLGYRLLPLWEERIILEALGDMKRAGGQVSPDVGSCDDWKSDSKHSTSSKDSKSSKHSYSSKGSKHSKASDSGQSSNTPATVGWVYNWCGTTNYTDHQDVPFLRPIRERNFR